MKEATGEASQTVIVIIVVAIIAAAAAIIVPMLTSQVKEGADNMSAKASPTDPFTPKEQ